MGMWAVVKVALNKTLGTSNFKSLDEIIVEQTNNYVLTASNDVILSQSVNFPLTSISNKDTQVYTFTPMYDGELNISFKASRNMSNVSNYPVTFKLINEYTKETVSTQQFEIARGTTAFTTTDLKVNVRLHEKYGIYLSAENNLTIEYFTITQVNIKGKKTAVELIA